MRHDTVSVHIVTYNSGTDIIACLESLYLQSYSIEEIIIIDNASIDDTVNLINDFIQERLQEEESPIRIQLIQKDTNSGFAAAHNEAIQMTNSSYTLILNPDVILHPDYVYYLVNAMQAKDRIGSATGKLLRKQNNGTEKSYDIIDSTGLTMKKSRRAFDRGAGEKDFGQWNLQKDIFGVSGAAALYQRKMIDDISIDDQFFDEDFFAYKEDVDVAWRAQLAGWASCFEPKAIGVHKRGWKNKVDRRSIPLYIRKHSYSNRYYVLLKNDTLFYVLLHFPFILGYEIMSILYILIKEREMKSSWKEIFKNLYIMIEKRKKILAGQKNPSSKIYKYFK